eukprot:2097681-Prymnesium_polylepis.1
MKGRDWLVGRGGRHQGVQSGCTRHTSTVAARCGREGGSRSRHTALTTAAWYLPFQALGKGETPLRNGGRLAPPKWSLHWN